MNCLTSIQRMGFGVSIFFLFISTAATASQIPVQRSLECNWSRNFHPCFRLEVTSSYTSSLINYNPFENSISHLPQMLSGSTGIAVQTRRGMICGIHYRFLDDFALMKNTPLSGPGCCLLDSYVGFETSRFSLQLSLENTLLRGISGSTNNFCYRLETWDISNVKSMPDTPAFISCNLVINL